MFRIALAVALCASCTIPGLSRAAVIDGTPLKIYADGIGDMQVRPAGLPDGEFDPPNSDAARAGVCLMIDLGFPAGSCGNQATNITPAAVTGSGTVGDPYKLTTTYGVHDMEVTQTLTYVNGDGVIPATYDIKNVAAAPQSFRTVVQADLSHAGSDLGQGSYDPTAPPALYGYNDDRGSFAGLVADSPVWDRYEEASIADFPMMDASGIVGFSNSVDPSLVDDWIGVQFDQYTTSGLPPSQTTTVKVDWVFGYYAGLTVSPSATALQTGETETITATSLAQGLPVTGVPMRYIVEGANPSNGAPNTGPDGSAQISLGGANAGTDTVTIFVDANGNGTFDPDTETQRHLTITWTAAPPPPTPPTPPPPSGPSASEIAALLQSTLTQFRARLQGKAPSVLLHTPAPHVNFNAPAAGLLTATLTKKSAGATGRSARALILASAKVTFPAPGTRRVTLHATRAGRRALRHVRRVKATLTLAFTPQAGGAPISRHVSVVLRARHR
jgi:hypothetical protein